MVTLDTNVLVRLLVKDDARQSAIALTLIERSTKNSDALFVPLTVVLELEWVLRSRYRYSKDVFIATLASLLETRELRFQDEPAVEHALHFYRESTADFAECLHRGCSSSSAHLPFVTFDRRASRLPGASLAR